MLSCGGSVNNRVMSRRTLLTIGALLLAGLWGGALGYRQLDRNIPVLERFEAALSDLRANARGERSPPDVTTIVAIDDETVRLAKRFPLPRLELAHLIERIAALDPKAIVVDILLVEPGSGDGDAALAQALQRRPTVLASAAVFPSARQDVDADTIEPLSRLPAATSFLVPLSAFSAHTATGAVNLSTDASGTPRAFPMLFHDAQRIELSLPLQAVASAEGVAPIIAPGSIRFGDRIIATDIGHQLPIAFYGPRGKIRTLSAAGPLPADAIAGRVVIIGTTVTGGADFFPTPFDPVMPGVEIVATAINHLMTGDGLLRDHGIRRIDALIAVILPMLLIGLLAWRRNAVGLIFAAVLIAAVLIVNVLAFWRGIHLSAALPIAAATPPLLLFGGLQLWSGQRRAQHFASRTELFRQFQAPALQRMLSEDPTFLLEPVRQNASVVFIDLSGFTALSETLSAELVRELLKDFHALIDGEAEHHGGIVTSFMGDGAMILFGLPSPWFTDASHAASCCAKLSRKTSQWLATLPRETAAKLHFKIGAHCGEIVASRLGGDGHQHITAIGDTVNIASRLMEVAARHGAELAISDQMLKQAGPDCVLLHTGDITGPRDTTIRGRKHSLQVWLWRDRPADTTDSVLQV